MTQYVVALVMMLVSAPLLAQEELTVGAGFSDVSFWTHGIRTATLSGAFEGTLHNHYRWGVGVTKEGRYLHDGWNVDLHLGYRHSLGSRFSGTARLGAMLTYPNVSYGNFQFVRGANGRVEQSTWRYVSQNGPADFLIWYPYLEYGVQCPARGPLFIQPSLRTSIVKVGIHDFDRARGAGAARSVHRRTIIPGYFLAAGFRW